MKEKCARTLESSLSATQGENTSNSAFSWDKTNGNAQNLTRRDNCDLLLHLPSIQVSSCYVEEKTSSPDWKHFFQLTSRQDHGSRMAIMSFSITINNVGWQWYLPRYLFPGVYDMSIIDLHLVMHTRYRNRVWEETPTRLSNSQLASRIFYSAYVWTSTPRWISGISTIAVLFLASVWAHNHGIWFDPHWDGFLFFPQAVNCWKKSFFFWREKKKKLRNAVPADRWVGWRS